MLFPIWIFAQNDSIKSNKNNWTNSDFSFKNETIKKSKTLEKKDDIIKTSILPYLWGEFNLSFEKKISNRTSLRIGIGSLAYHTITNISDNNTDSTKNNNVLNTFYFTSDFRVYLGWKKANRGFYIAPNIIRRYFSIKDTNTKVIVNKNIIGGAGLLIGNQWIANSFVYDLNTGVIAYDGRSHNDLINKIYYLPNLNFSIGYAF